jgi:hypothetical protein
MNCIELTGLRANLPIGAMAAFGCLRVCERLAGWQGSKLSWRPSGGGFHAALWTPASRSPEELIAALIEDVKGAAGRPELQWSEQIKTATRESFVKSALAAIARASSGNRETADWFAAFGSDLALDDEKIEPTPFDMSVARQKFLADARKLASGLGEARSLESGKTADTYREALFGPWRYKDDQHSLGWDPSTMKLGAFSYKAPTAMANTGVRAAVWLAFESLPLFPCFYGRGLKTRAFRRQGRGVAFRWPVWEAPISLATLATVLGSEILTVDNPSPEELRARGLTAILQSTKFKPNKYLASFRAPELAVSARAGGR